MHTQAYTATTHMHVGMHTHAQMYVHMYTCTHTHMSVHMQGLTLTCHLQTWLATVLLHAECPWQWPPGWPSWEPWGLSFFWCKMGIRDLSLLKHKVLTRCKQASAEFP